MHWLFSSSASGRFTLLHTFSHCSSIACSAVLMNIHTCHLTAFSMKKACSADLCCRSVHCHVLGKPVECHIARIFHNYSFFINLHCSLRVMVLSEHLWLGVSSECSWFLLFLDLKVESCLFRFVNCLKNWREKGIDKGDWFGSCSPTYWSSLPLKQPSI